MTPVVLALVAAALVGWLAFLGLSALRARGKEEIPPNLAPGKTDDALETRRLERVQTFAVFSAAFLAIGLPLYYLGEQQRQAGFVEQFDDESVRRGEHLVTEFACFSCHGPGGSGGGAAFIEKRSGISVLWTAPSLDDVFYRYERDEVTFWVTYGRGNTPMPAWGLPGGGPMNEQQVGDVVNYLQTIQVSQEDALAKIEPRVTEQLARLDGAEETVRNEILKQQQLIKNVEAAPALAPVARELATEARAAFDGATDGLDTDGDGLSDGAETKITGLLSEAQLALTPPGLVVMPLDPAMAETTPGTPDADAAEAAVASLEAMTAAAPIVTPFAEAARAALIAADEGEDQDQDGLSDEAEATIAGQLTQALQAIRPATLSVVTLDPTQTETNPGQRDRRAASRAVSSLETVATNLSVTADNQEELVGSAQQGLNVLLRAAEAQQWAVDFQALAEAGFDGDSARAERAVGLFNAYCARCHTSGWSAGVPYTQPAGSGGFGPALWEGRPNVQFLTHDDLMAFITTGSEGQKPYGVNGFGSGRMPAFGKILSKEDIDLIATYLRSGNLTGLD